MKKNIKNVIGLTMATVMAFSSLTVAYANDNTVEDQASVELMADETTSDSAIDTDETTSGPAVDPGEDEPSGSAVAEAGKTYTWDLMTDAALPEKGGNMADWKTADGMLSVVSPSGKAMNHGSGHGIALADGDQISFPVAGNAKITFNSCQYSKNDKYTLTDAEGNVVGTLNAYAKTADGKCGQSEYTYIGKATTITATLNATGTAYLHGAVVSNYEAVPEGVESWSLMLQDLADETGTIKSGAQDVPCGYLELVTGFNGEQWTQYGKDYTVEVDGVAYKTYKAGNRPTECNAFTQLPTEGTCMIFRAPAKGTLTTYFYSGSFLRVTDFVENEDGSLGAVTTSDSEAGAPSYTVSVEPGHVYILSTTGKTNNMFYAGVKYIVDEPVSVDINLTGEALGAETISLVDVDLGKTEAVINANTTNVVLSKGHTYKLESSTAGLKPLTNGNETFKADGAAVTINVENVPDVTLSGKFTWDVEADPSIVTKITFTNMKNAAQFYETVPAADGSYTLSLKPGEYNTTVEVADGSYATWDRVSVPAGADTTNDIYLERTVVEGYTKYDLPTEVTNATADPASSVLKFENIKFNNSTSVANSVKNGVATITVPVEAGKNQRVTVSGWYSGTWDINGKNAVTTNSSANAASPTTTSYITDGTETSVTVNLDTVGTTYLYWITVEDCVTFKKEINVPGDYATLGEAVTAINNMVGRPEGEEGRVTINLTDDIFEQVLVDAKYVTINGNDHEISWYYGVGSKYYSVDSNGYYSERLFRDKYSKTEASGSLWGGVVIVTGDYFKAYNTTFKNTYNYYMTQKELDDGVETISLPPRDSLTTDVATHAAKERSNALYTNAAHMEIYNCKILSSQDTLGVNGDRAGYYAYFKDCVIGGNVDYICGAGTMVFDNCELQWKTYSDTAKNNGIGYITAPKTSPYIFRNCTVTTDKEVEGVLGKWGRTWGSNSYGVFVNCETNGTIDEAGWGEMSSGELKTAKFNEFNNTSNGVVMEVSKVGEPLPADEIKAVISTDILSAHLDGWVPEACKDPLGLEAKLATADSFYAGKTTSLTDLEIASLKPGDADSDGVYTAADAAIALKLSKDMEIANTWGIDVLVNLAMDVDNSDKGKVTSGDAQKILMKARDFDYDFK